MELKPSHNVHCLTDNKGYGRQDKCSGGTRHFSLSRNAVTERAEACPVQTADPSLRDETLA